MGIPKAKKMEEALDKLEKEQNESQQKSKNVINSIAGRNSKKTKLIHDKNGRVREVKIKEPRKAFQVYLPESIFEKLSTVLDANGKSRNGLIEELIRNYLEEE